MSFIRKKKIKGRIYYYEVKNTRVGKKTVQKVVRYLGTAEDIGKAVDEAKSRRRKGKEKGKGKK